MLRGFVRAVHLFYAVLMHCRVTECSKATSCFTGGNVIVMQLDRQPVGAAKVRQHVAFPDELDLRPWMHPESPDLTGNASCMYDLVSLIVHQGKASTGGHYVAVCRLGPAEGNCPPHANKGSPNLPQAAASIACTVCRARISDVTGYACGLLFIGAVMVTSMSECTCLLQACDYGFWHWEVTFWPGPAALVCTSTSAHDGTIACDTDCNPTVIMTADWDGTTD